MGQQNKKRVNNNLSLDVRQFEAQTIGQEDVEDNFDDFDVLSLRGMPGTGKTFWAMYLAFQRLLRKSSPYFKVIIIRSTVPVRRSGFLPGTQDEKNAPYATAYHSHCAKIFGRGDAYELLIKHGMLEFESTDFLRGTEWNNCIVIVDEPQNMADNELHTINTRFGQDCKLVFCGDTGQDDLTNERYKEESGYARMNRIHDGMESAFSVVFTVEDIIRSGYIKEYLIQRERTA
ncbi:phosphate starvation-inducible protein [Rhizobium phage RHph_I1_18]|nr:phosphate starvation-inducible protein [Rhizobium phage RHph_I1_18]